MQVFSFFNIYVKTSPIFLTLAEALPVCFPLEPCRLLSFWHCLSNLLFSSSNTLFSSNSNLTYIYHIHLRLLLWEHEVQCIHILAKRFTTLLTSSSALLRFILKCSLSFSSVFTSATRDKTF